MPLLPSQRAALEQYKKFRETTPTIGQLMWTSAVGYAVLLISLTALVAFWTAIGQRENVVLLWGFAFGYFVRDFQLLRMTKRHWPFLSEILDWEKIDAIMAVDATDKPSTQS